jgi:DNA-binding transcriptional LysR family regulator
MDLRQIMYLMAAYEARSITKAARKVGLVQPALSVQIKRALPLLSTKMPPGPARRDK